MIYCFGDSHVSMFSGKNELLSIYTEKNLLQKFSYHEFVPVRLGAVLAYSLLKSNTKEKGHEKLESLFNQIPINSNVIFLFGEIDIRCHVLKIHFQTQQKIEDIIMDIIDQYMKYSKIILKRGYSLSIIGPMGTSNLKEPDPEYPFYGSHYERNRATLIFDKILKEKCQLIGIHYITLARFTIRRNYQTRLIFYFDGIHLSQLIMPYVLIKSFKLYSKKKIFLKDFGLSLFKSFQTFIYVIINLFLKFIS